MSLKNHTKPDDKIYFINQNSDGFEKHVFAYSILPNKTIDWCWSFGNKYNSNDVWTCDQNLIDLVKDFDFLVIYYTDKKFHANYKSYFFKLNEEQTDAIFKIENSKTNEIKFTLVN